MCGSGSWCALVKNLFPPGSGMSVAGGRRPPGESSPLVPKGDYIGRVEGRGGGSVGDHRGHVSQTGGEKRVTCGQEVLFVSVTKAVEKKKTGGSTRGKTSLDKGSFSGQKGWAREEKQGPWSTIGNVETVKAKSNTSGIKK